MSGKIDRRHFLQQTALAAGAVLVKACAPQTPVTPTPPETSLPDKTPPISPEPTAEEQPTTHPDIVLTFLHTNDTHGHLAPFRVLEYPEPVGGMARRATLVRQIRQQAEHVLLVDAGDIHQGCLMADTFHGKPDIELMNQLGYVAMGLGNHDLDYGWESVFERQQEAFFPILCANLLYTDSGKPVLPTHTIVQEGGVRIALTSFAGPEWPYIVPAQHWTNVTLADPIETARTLIPQLADQADLIVVLGHQYLQNDSALAKAVPGIDIIIGGHEHIQLNEAVQVGGTLIVEADQWGAYLGRLDVAVSGGQITSYAYALLPLTADIPADPEIEAQVGLLEAEMQQLNPARFEQVGHAAIDISDKDIRAREAPLGDLVCDIMREKNQTDAAMITSLTILNSLFAGPLTVQDIYDALPYPNEILIARLPGELLQQLLDLSASSAGTGNFSQVSGIRFRIVGGAATQVMVGEKPLDAARVYTLATTDYQVRQADGYRELLAQAIELQSTGLSVKEILIEYIRVHSPIRAQTDGRIVFDQTSHVLGKISRHISTPPYLVHLPQPVTSCGQAKSATLTTSS